MKSLRKQHLRKARRAQRIRSKIRGTGSYPRLSIFRSNRHISAQLIDDARGVTLCGASDLEMPKHKQGTAPKKLAERAMWVGARIAEKAHEHNITNVVLDRGRYRYHGAVHALADAARKAGLVL